MPDADLMGGSESPAPHLQPLHQPPPPPPQQQQDGGGMFSGLDLASDRSGPASPLASQQPSSTAAPDMFGGLSLAGGSTADALQQPGSSHQQRVRPPADELADLFTSLAGPDAAAAPSQPSFNGHPAEPLAWQQHQHQHQHQQPHNASPGFRVPAVRTERSATAESSGSGKFGGKGSVFDDLDAETRQTQTSMGGCPPCDTSLRCKLLHLSEQLLQLAA